MGRTKMKSLKNSFGTCICGAVRFRISEEPTTLFACHCSDCQTVTGSGFVLALQVPYDGIVVTQGEAKPYERKEADERKRIIHRCPHCLTILWSERPDSKEYITVYGGTLDESPTLKPIAHIWTRDTQQWMKLPDDVLLFEENPPNMNPLLEAWRTQNEWPIKSPQPTIYGSAVDRG
jgi:hypothetical protein